MYPVLIPCTPHLQYPQSTVIVLGTTSHVQMNKGTKEDVFLAPFSKGILCFHRGSGLENTAPPTPWVQA